MKHPEYLYLLVDLGSIAIPFAFSFHPRFGLTKAWKPIWVSILLVALPFIAWDMLFTRWSVWGFNAQYLTGIYVLNLPLEEILFFICIPYACLFTYRAIGLLSWTPPERAGTFIASFLILASLGMALVFYNRWYTVFTFGGLAVTLAVLRYKSASYLAQFFLAYAIILIPFFIVNGILTGYGIPGEVVWYNPAENLGVRVSTIPVEDIFYGMLLILLNVSVYERLRKDTDQAST